MRQHAYEFIDTAQNNRMQPTLKITPNLNMKGVSLRKGSDKTDFSNDLAVQATQKGVFQRPEPKAVYSNSPTQKRKK